MKAYSLDLRTRVLAAVDRGQLTQGQIADQFQVSDRWIRQLLRRRAQTGSSAPRPPTRRWIGFGWFPVPDGATRLEVPVDPSHSSPWGL
jgi:hypothetical protein